jgi:hypothetical protein
MNDRLDRFIETRSAAARSAAAKKSTILMWQGEPSIAYRIDEHQQVLQPTEATSPQFYRGKAQECNDEAQECEHRSATATRPFVYIAWRNQQHDNKPKCGASAYKRTPLTPAAYPAGPIHYPPVMITGVAPGYPYPEVQECIRHTTNPHG